MLNNKTELIGFIKLVNKKLLEHNNISYCVNISTHTENELKKHFKLTYEPFSFIKFEHK